MVYKKLKAVVSRREYDKLRKQYDELREELDQATKELVDSRVTIREFAREKARRVDQFRALLQAHNLVLAVASNEIIDFTRGSN